MASPPVRALPEWQQVEGLETQPMKKPKADYAIQTVINAMRLLESFRDEEELGVTEISRRLGLHKNNVFRLLATLEQQGYIEQCRENDRYRLGVRSLELGQAFARSRTLLRMARAVLEDLAQRCQESVHLGVMRDFEVIHVDGAQSDHLVLTGLRIGRRLPVHATALGKVLLGCSPEEVRQSYDRSIVAGRALEQRTPSTITDPHKFFEHIRTVAVGGFALDLEECEVGLCCAAAPVFDGDGEVVAAVSVSGPAFRCGEARLLDEIVPRVTGAAEELSRHLGYAA
jgi:IclR family KDG regulon transcriptional repressor